MPCALSAQYLTGNFFAVIGIDDVEFVHCIRQSHADKLISASVGFGGKVIIKVSNALINANGEHDSLRFFAQPDLLIHNTHPNNILNIFYHISISKDMFIIC